MALLTDFGTNAFSYQHDPWGVQTLTSGGTGNGAPQNPYAFHAGIKDPGSGLVKFGIRWYNPATGTWNQQDALDEPLDPANANRYAYAGDGPINGQDLTGNDDARCLFSSLIAIGSADLLVVSAAGEGATFALDTPVTIASGLIFVGSLGTATSECFG